MKALVAFYDRLYFDLTNLFVKGRDRREQLAFASCTLAVFEAWFCFDGYVAFRRLSGDAHPLPALRGVLILAFAAAALINAAYFLPRHERIHASLSWRGRSERQERGLILFYAAPLALLVLLLVLRSA